MAINSIGPTRLFGLSSGMDTESLVKSLMRLEQMKLNRELRAKATLQWKQDALNNVAGDLRTFKNTFLTTLGANAMLSTNVYTSFNVELSGSMKDAVSISANSEAFASQVTVNKITQLALGGKAESSKVSAGGGQLSEGNYIALGDLEFANDLFVDQAAHPVDSIAFQINGVNFTFDKSTTLHDMLSTVNNSEAGVTMTYSRLTDGFTISTRETGADKELKIVNKVGNAFGSAGAFGIDQGVYKGSDAVAYVNGIRVQRSDNTFTIDGIRYNLNRVTGTESEDEKINGILDPADTEHNDPATAITASFTKNIDNALNSIKSFVEGYNTLIKKLNGLLTEKKDSRYYALTEEEKAEMTDKQIEQWESMAKSGLLRSDRDLQNLLSNMRMAFYSTIEGVGLSPQQIGLRSGEYLKTTPGEIVIDENALRTALEKDSDRVMRVFMNPTSSNKPAEQGLIYRLSDAIDKYVSGNQDYTLDSIAYSLNKLSDRIMLMEKRMLQTQERYYNQFAIMENAMAEMMSQSNWLNSIMNSLMGGR